ncbi:MAG TPA: response regulator transcription factor [Candidatus Acidoferrum sp.]|nr:response regulator transcription factor [Candidatus Acidoferrum sp.]
MARTRVVLADDHAVVAQGLSELLKDSFDLLEVVHDGHALLDAADRLRPDVVVTDISMPLLNGLEAIRQIRARHPEIKIVVLTMHADTQTAVSAFRAGAQGYVVKVSPEQEFTEAIEQVAQGRAYISPLVAKELIDVLLEAGNAGPERARLTVRQREVLQLIAEGKTMKEVASVLKISPRTAESHKYEIMQVLGVDNTAALVQYAVRAGLVGD